MPVTSEGKSLIKQIRSTNNFWTRTKFKSTFQVIVESTSIDCTGIISERERRKGRPERDPSQNNQCGDAFCVGNWEAWKSQISRTGKSGTETKGETGKTQTILFRIGSLGGTAAHNHQFLEIQITVGVPQSCPFWGAWTGTRPKGSQSDWWLYTW